MRPVCFFFQIPSKQGREENRWKGVGSDLAEHGGNCEPPTEGGPTCDGGVCALLCFFFRTNNPTPVESAREGEGEGEGDELAHHITEWIDLTARALHHGFDSFTLHQPLVEEEARNITLPPHAGSAQTRLSVSCRQNQQTANYASSGDSCSWSPGCTGPAATR